MLRSQARRAMILRLMLFPDGYSRGRYLKKKKVFHAQGEHCYFAPHNFGTEPYLISFGNNVHVASGVKFVNHDICAGMFRYMDPQGRYVKRVGPISVGDNVFIGANATVLYDARIGNNVIVAAGAVVTGELPDGGIYGGVPARRIGDFDGYMEKCRRFGQSADWSDGSPARVQKAGQIRLCYPRERE